MFKKNPLGQSFLINMFSILLLTIFAFWLFRAEFAGYVWIGNSDRLNSDLKVMQHYLLNTETKSINAWDQNEMMGYDSFALPYTFPNPLVPLMHMFDDKALFSVMGFVVIVLLAMAGISAYAFTYNVVGAGIATFTAAICYQFSALTILKVSQNSMSFAVFIVFPLAALCIRGITRATAANRFLILSLLLGFMLGFMFLQKAAYVLMFLGTYAIWRAKVIRSIWPIYVFGAALLIALIFAAPRIINIGIAMGEYARTISGLNFHKFEALYDFQNIRPFHIWRWLDDGIFGRSTSSAAIDNNVQLSEGFLLYTSALVPCVLAAGLMRSLVLRWRQTQPQLPSDAIFFGIALLFCILVVVWKVAAKGMYFLFLRMDFTHARILIAALLPMVVLLAMSLKQLQPRLNIQGTRFRQLIIWGLSVVIALLINLGIGWVAQHNTGWWAPGGNPYKLSMEALTRITVSLGLFLFAVILLFLKRISPTIKKITYISLCVFISIQCLLGANERVNGREMFNFTRPFFMGDMYYARKAEFGRPTAEQLAILHKRLQSDSYRIALICDPQLAGGFCAGHVPEFWNLRAIDGYYGLGVPVRLRALPWPAGVISLRTISFARLEDVPWPLLGFLNVQSVLIADDGIYRNIVRDGTSLHTVANPNNFSIIHSPARVTPRAFFSQNILAVKNADEAVSKIFRNKGIVDPLSTSFVENFPYAKQNYSSPVPVTIEGQGDRLLLRFSAAPTARFLVLNELYYPGWKATAEGNELQIYPTNAVMRGVVVPAGVKEIVFHYTSVAVTPTASYIRYLAIFLLFSIFFYLRRLSTTNTDKRCCNEGP